MLDCMSSWAPWDSTYKYICEIHGKSLISVGGRAWRRIDILGCIVYRWSKMVAEERMLVCVLGLLISRDPTYKIYANFMGICHVGHSLWSHILGSPYTADSLIMQMLGRPAWRSFHSELSQVRLASQLGLGSNNKLFGN